MSTVIPHTAIIRSWNANKNPDTYPFQNCINVLNLYKKFRSSDWIKSRKNLDLAKNLVTQLEQIQYDPQAPESILTATNEAIKYITDMKDNVENPSNASCLAAMCIYLTEHLESCALSQTHLIKIMGDTNISLNQHALSKENDKLKAEIVGLKNRNDLLIHQAYSQQTHLNQEALIKQKLEKDLTNLQQQADQDKNSLSQQLQLVTVERDKLVTEKQQSELVSRQTKKSIAKKLRVTNGQLTKEVDNLKKEIIFKQQMIDKQTQDIADMFSLQGKTGAEKTQKVLELNTLVNENLKTHQAKIDKLNGELQTLTNELSLLTKSHHQTVTENRLYDKTLKTTQTELEQTKLKVQKLRNVATVGAKFLNENNTLIEQMDQLRITNKQLIVEKEKLEKENSIFRRLLAFVKSHTSFWVYLQKSDPILEKDLASCSVPEPAPPSPGFFGRVFGTTPTPTTPSRSPSTPTTITTRSRITPTTSDF